MKRKIFLLKCKILKHRITSILWKHCLLYLLMPFALIYGVIIALYGISKGMTKEEVKSKYVDEVWAKILKHYCS